MSYWDEANRLEMNSRQLYPVFEPILVKQRDVVSSMKATMVYMSAIKLNFILTPSPLITLMIEVSPSIK